MIVLYGHEGSGNHGCEAIVRTTVQMLNQPCKLVSTNKDQDTKYGIEEICEVKSDQTQQLKRGSGKWLLARADQRLNHRIDTVIKYQRADLLNEINSGDICLSIGGDTYCYSGNEILSALNSNIKKKGAKTVLWGCSVEPELLKNTVIAADLSSYDLIAAREPISYEALKRINPNTVMVSDPAFTLQSKELPLPVGWQQGNMIGINASPLILNRAEHEDTVLDAYRNLIEYILENTSCGIALIPHVVWAQSDDRTVLKLFYDEFKETGRVVILEDHNCEELKGFISRCRLFIGARTHATIAAYSTCVPTLVLGYSVKSKGIARALFGTDEHYVIPVQSFTSRCSLTEAFKWLEANEQSIRARLEKTIPEYSERAYVAVEAIRKLMK